MTVQFGGPRSDDRRIAARVPFRQRVRLRFDAIRDVVDATTLDLSVGGMFVETSSFREPGAELEFEISLSGNDETIAGTAEVVRVRGGDSTLQPSGMGLRFLELRGRSRETLRRLTEARDPADLPAP